MSNDKRELRILLNFERNDFGRGEASLAIEAGLIYMQDGEVRSFVDSSYRAEPYADLTLAGHVSPMLYLLSVCTGTLGLTGLFLEIRHHRQQHHTSPHDETATEMAARAA